MEMIKMKIINNIWRFKKIKKIYKYIITTKIIKISLKKSYSNDNNNIWRFNVCILYNIILT